MSSLVVRNLPENVHANLKRLAKERGKSVEAVARELLAEGSSKAGPFGVDFDRIAEERARLGVTEDGPEWTEAMDDPALSRRLLGLDP